MRMKWKSKRTLKGPNTDGCREKLRLTTAVSRGDDEVLGLSQPFQAPVMSDNKNDRRLNRYASVITKFSVVTVTGILLYVLSIPLVLLLELRQTSMSQTQTAHAYLTPILALEASLAAEPEEHALEIQADDGKIYVPLHTPALLTNQTPTLLIPFESYLLFYGFDVEMAYWAHQLEFQYNSMSDEPILSTNHYPYPGERIR